MKWQRMNINGSEFLLFVFLTGQDGLANTKCADVNKECVVLERLVHGRTMYYSL